MKEVLVLRDLECIKAIAHPRRIDILKTFDKAPLSAKQLSQLLDEPHAKINYHIKTLYKVGILELVEEKIKSGIVEKYYYPKAKNIVVGKKVLNFSLHTEEEQKELSISKFENMSELFYNAAEEERLLDKSVIEYNNVGLTQSEINELNNAIKLKLDEILKSRDNTEMDEMFDIALLTIPISESESFNI
ncbi:ArsR/SmtB family transcription factor [Romboutsia lituseburensis]|uniref:ArsR/SmtB family transcription factor n=1 Tax=Romboutsia lituseburensis TaxID=1537 RepID=UPI00215B18F0|nr:helix-turn-helix domain-containing protein [Romboutsia lituseburensis]MCR8745610.1 helix-turn-helix domain-containing protein [Romboutsia lituseburensis]